MDINHLLMVVSTTALSTVTGILFAAARMNWKAFKNIRSSQQALIRDRIVQAYDDYHQKGRIGRYTLSTLEELYGEYVNLDGNGFVKEIMEEIRKLRVE